ncbi:kinase-like domain-containing protein [Chlamydoabsidia padenii]|nr:kinase-like domain-containing protein [Chlamydoabsidia padenii]
MLPSTTLISTTLQKSYDGVTGHKYINQYEMLNEIGRGVHGKVKLAQHVDTRSLVAIKIIDKHKKKRHYSLLRASSSSSSTSSTDQHHHFQDQHDQSIRREMLILQKCQHPNIIQLLEIIDDPHCRKLYMVLEYTEGGAITWRDEQDRPVLTKSTSRRMFKDIVNGLDYLHDQGIIHRDIKPANLLLTKDQVVKISDFGTSYDASRDDPKCLMETVGTPAFFAPELCRSSVIPPTRSMDIWSLGVTLYCFLFGVCPFMAPTEYELFELIPTMVLTFPSTCGASLMDLLNALLTKDPVDRITLKQVQVHPWVHEESDNDDDDPSPQSSYFSPPLPTYYKPKQPPSSLLSSIPSHRSPSPSSTTTASSLPAPQQQRQEQEQQIKPTLAERLRITMTRWIRRKPATTKASPMPSSPKKKEFSKLRPLSCFTDMSY